MREGIKIAKRCSIKLTVLSVLETNPEYDAVAPGMVEKAEHALRVHLENVVSRAMQEGIVCETVVRHGDPYSDIINEAIKQQSTMIVMGRTVSTGFERLIMGSTTARVIGCKPYLVWFCLPKRPNRRRTIPDAIGYYHRAPWHSKL